jgi:glutathione S-transferase
MVRCDRFRDMSLRLYTFAISHFSEKARWALDLSGVEYEERRVLPGPHMATIRWIAPNSCVPVLRHDKKVVQGSSAILDYLEQSLGAKQLAPDAAAQQRSQEIEALADRAFGLGTQRIFYDTLLHHRDGVVSMWAQDGPWWSRLFYGVAYPLVARFARHMYKIRPDVVAKAKVLFREAMDATDQALAGSPYLLGNRLSRLDVTVASLLAPMCRPPEHVLRWPAVFPEELAEFVAEFEGRPTYDFVIRMYREHRRPS